MAKKDDISVDTKQDVSRRGFLTAARTPSVDYGVYEPPIEDVPVPPVDADVVPTACEYCIVGCGYKAYT